MRWYLILHLVARRVSLSCTSIPWIESLGHPQPFMVVVLSRGRRSYTVRSDRRADGQAGQAWIRLLWRPRIVTILYAAVCILYSL